MLVPKYWAEGRVQGRVGKRSVTVRRFGWSDASQEEAQEKADARAREAFERVSSGTELPRREPKVAYNGAEGVPIREEIVSRHGEAVVTRNSYGARCLNTPDVLFADVDFATRMPWYVPTACCVGVPLAVLVTGLLMGSWGVALFGSIGALIVGGALVGPVDYILKRLRGGQERLARKRINAFIQTHGDWHLRLYRTPAGLRVMAMHRTFDPGEKAVAEFFKALGTDPVYMRMCLNQRCFRARVSPKPWRVGVEQHLRPRPGVWPINPERMPDRARWVESYEKASQGYAACRYVESLGSGATAQGAREVQEIHDEMCRAMSELPIA